MDATILLGLKRHSSGGTALPLLAEPVGARLRRPEVQARMRAPVEAFAAPTGGEPEVLDVRELSAEELELARHWSAVKSANGADVRTPPPAAEASRGMREKHHNIARVMAAGVALEQIASLVGLNQSTLTNMKKSPAFQSLLFSYMHELDNVAKDFKGRLEATAGAALNELHERLVSEPETFSPEVLRKTVETLADRIGHGPTSKTISATVALTPEDIRALKAGLVSPVQVNSPDPLRVLRDAALPAESGEQPESEEGAEVREEGQGGASGATGPQLDSL
jgi:hypothetical protein